MSSPHMSVSLNEVRHGWSMDDLLDAHITLDLIDELEAKATQKARRGAGRR